MPQDPEAEFDALIGTSPDPEEAKFDEAMVVDHARELVANQPTQLGGGIPLQTPFVDKPWHEQFSDVAAPFTSYIQNVGDTAMGGFSDEGASALLNPSQSPVDRAKNGPAPADPNTYAAGSRFEDNRQTLQADKAQRDKDNPIPAVMGRVTGAVAQGAALPGAAWGAGAASRLAGAAAGAGTGAALTGAQLLGEGAGDLSQRTDQAVEQVQEHPIATGAGVAIPALAAGAIRPAARAIEGGLNNVAAENTVEAFTTPSQRAALIKNRGPEAVRDLGKNVREQGLHKQPWYAPFLPPNAKTYYQNASKAREAANEGMQAAEGQIVAAGDPKIDIGSIADDLEAGATKVEKMWDKPAAEAEANFRRQQAKGISPEQSLPEGLEGPTSRRREAPFSETLENRRYNDQNINYNARGGYEGAGMQEQVRRQVGGQLRNKIDDGLEQAVQRGEVPPEVAAQWRAEKKKYATAAAVEDPALAAMERDSGGKTPLGLRDAAILSTFGPIGTLSDKAMAGRWPSFKANQAARGAKVAGAVGSDKSAGAVSNVVREETAPDPQIAREKNEEMKEGLVETVQHWFSSLLGQ